MSFRFWLVAPLVTLGLSTAVAQQFAPTTVQLPTFSTFSVGTVVAVPDSGWGFAHRPCQVSHGWTAFGPAWGASTTHWETFDQVSMWSMGAQVIDVGAFDVQLLASAASQPVVASDPFAQQIVASRESTAAFVPGSVADARRARAAELDEKVRAVDELVAKADALLSEGKANAARVYLQMAAGKATGERKVALEQRAAALKHRPAR
jgi:hypothetical protein